MASPPPQAIEDYWTGLLRKYQARNISLRECYELKRWLEDSFIKHSRTPAQDKALANVILSGVEAVIADKEYRGEHK